LGAAAFLSARIDYFAADNFAAVSFVALGFMAVGVVSAIAFGCMCRDGRLSE